MFFEALPNKKTLPQLFLDLYNDKFEQDAKVYLGNFFRLINKKPPDDEIIINFIEKTENILLLMKLTFIDKRLDAWCADPRLSNFWDEVWRASCPTSQQAMSQEAISS